VKIFGLLSICFYEDFCHSLHITLQQTVNLVIKEHNFLLIQQLVVHHY